MTRYRSSQMRSVATLPRRCSRLQQPAKTVPTTGGQMSSGRQSLPPEDARFLGFELEISKNPAVTERCEALKILYH